MSLGNIHAIASSHASLLKAVSTQAESSNWHALIESTGWLTHVSDLLKAAGGRDGIVGKMFQDNYSVLVVRIYLNMLRLQPYMILTDDNFLLIFLSTAQMAGTEQRSWCLWLRFFWILTSVLSKDCAC